MWKYIKDLFKKRAWQEINRVFLRSEMDESGLYCMKYYLVTYKDLFSGDIKQKEIMELRYTT